MNNDNWNAYSKTPIQFGEGYYDFGEDIRRARWDFAETDDAGDDR